MLKRLSSREQLEALASQWEPTLRAAWEDAIDRIRSNVVLKTIIELLEKHEVDAAVRALGIDEDFFARFEIELVRAYNDGGLSTVDNMPSLRDPSGNKVVFAWGVRNLPGEQEIRQHAAEMVTNTAEDMKAGLRTVLAGGLERGQSPNVTAYRVKSYIGLSARQMETGEWIERGLRSGDTEAMRRYLKLKVRAKGPGAAFDKAVLRAIASGEAVPGAMIGKIMTGYAKAATTARAKIIARHETIMALDKSRDDAFRKQINDGKLLATDITKTWRHLPQEHPRMQHVAMDKQTVGFDEPFIAPDETTLRFPRDPKAPGSHTIGCKCRIDYVTDHTGILLRQYRARTGG
ncbi:MAG: head morphogenesis protein [Mesorhizobium sp.]